MAPLYRNDETGLVQEHPRSGIGPSLNSTEITEDGKPIEGTPAKPRVPLGSSRKATAAARKRQTASNGDPKATGNPAGENKEGAQ